MELLHIEQIDTYSYIGDELYNKIMEISEVMTQNENSIKAKQSTTSIGATAPHGRG